MKACGIASSSLSTGEARPRVCRISCSEPGESRSELTERKLLGFYSPARGKKNLCRNKKLDRMDESVAISGQIRRLFADLSCERLHRDLVCTGARDNIMVLIKWRSDVPSDDLKMEIDWADDGDDQADDWRLQNYVDIKNRVNDNMNATEISSVDTTSIVTKTDPIPMKDVKQFFIDELFPGYRYAGNNNIRTELLKDEFNIKKDKRICRWAMNVIDQSMRIPESCESSEKEAQWVNEHHEATLKNEVKTYTPYEDFIDDTTGEHLPVIGVRVFHGGAQAVVNAVAYYYYYGYVRCNLAQDSHLAEGVYAYTDIAKALADIDKRDTFDRTKCLGLVAGYLRKSDNTKGRMCLDSRSCELLAVFSPFCTDIDLPFTLGMEDALSFRFHHNIWVRR